MTIIKPIIGKNKAKDETTPAVAVSVEATRLLPKPPVVAEDAKRVVAVPL